MLGTEAAVRALGDDFAKGFVQKNAELRASLFTQDGTFVTPVGDFLQGRVAMVKDFGLEAQQAVTATTQSGILQLSGPLHQSSMSRSLMRCLRMHNVNGPDGTIIPVIPIKFFYVAARHGDQWLIEAMAARISHPRAGQ